MTADRRLIDEPDGGRQFAAVRTAYMAITNGDAAAAAILNQFEYWTNSRLPDDAVDRRAALVAAGEVWVKQEQDTLIDVLWGVFKDYEIKRGFKLLYALGYLDKRRDPANRFKPTLQYRFDADAVQAAVDFWANDCLSLQVASREFTGDLTRRHRRPRESLPISSRGAMDDPPRGQGQPHEGIPVPSREVTGGPEVQNLQDKNLLQNPLENPGGEDAREAREGPAAADFSGNAPNIFELYDRHGIQPPLNDLQRDVLLDAAETYSADQIEYAFRDAADHGKRSWPYIRAILERLRTSPEPPKIAGRIGPTQAISEADHWRAAAAEHNPVDESGHDLPAAGEAAPSTPIPGTMAARLFAAHSTANPLTGDDLKAWESARQQIGLQLGRGPDWARWQGVTALRFEDDVLTLGVEDVTAARDFQNRLYRFLAGRVRDSFARDVRLVFETLALVPSGRPPEPRLDPPPPRDRDGDHSAPEEAPPRHVGQAAWARKLIREHAKETVH